MGLEYSEGFTAALSVMSDADLAMADSSAEGGEYNGVKFDKKYQEIYQRAIDLFNGNQIKDGAGQVTKTGMNKKMNQFKFKDGEVKIELFDDVAPKHVQRFKQLSDEKKNFILVIIMQ